MNFPAVTATTRLTPTRKGQVTLRRGLLDHLGIRNGEAIEVVPMPGGWLKVQPVPKTGSLDAFFGSIKYDGPPVSMDAMNETIAKGWAGELDDCD